VPIKVCEAATTKLGTTKSGKPATLLISFKEPSACITIVAACSTIMPSRNRATLFAHSRSMSSVNSLKSSSSGSSFKGELPERTFSGIREGISVTGFGLRALEPLYELYLSKAI
jgi:hypothetical protein